MKSHERKAIPVCTGVLDYFGDALFEVAKLSQLGNDKHNPGEPLHWSKGKSNDHADCLLRHLKERGKPDPDMAGLSHTVAVAWRALALLQLELESPVRSKTVVPVLLPGEYLPLKKLSDPCADHFLSKREETPSWEAWIDLQDSRKSYK